MSVGEGAQLIEFTKSLMDAEFNLRKACQDLQDEELNESKRETRELQIRETFAQSCNNAFTNYQRFLSQNPKLNPKRNPNLNFLIKGLYEIILVISSLFSRKKFPVLQVKTDLKNKLSSPNDTSISFFKPRSYQMTKKLFERTNRWLQQPLTLPRFRSG